MTREEEVRVSALKYVDNFIPDICGMCDEDVYDAFVSGAKWADEHPKDVWHNASEYPSKVGVILYQTTLGQFRTVCHGTSDEGIWKVFAKDYGVMRWAYISDLLPKGGKE